MLPFVQLFFQNGHGCQRPLSLLNFPQMIPVIVTIEINIIAKITIAIFDKLRHILLLQSPVVVEQPGGREFEDVVDVVTVGVHKQ